MLRYSTERNVPIPSTEDGRSRRRGPETAHMLTLEPGESFVVPADREKIATKALSNLHQSKHNRRFVSQLNSDGSRRIWRVR